MKSQPLVFEGAPLRVQVQDKRQAALERKARELMLGRTVSAVFLTGDQLEITLDDGGTFTMNCSGGFQEVG